MKKVAAIVVTFNKKQLLKQCLDALLDQSYPVSVFVIDNNSKDGTDELIASYTDEPRIHYYNTGANLGGAGGFNYGLKRAYSEGYDYFWLMDDDAVPDTSSLEALISAAETIHYQFGFLCSNVRFSDGTACKMNIPDLDKDWLNEYSHVSDSLLKVSRATFVGFFLSRDIVRRVGLPISDFFIWSDDSNYSHRISAIEPCYIVLNSIIVHHMAINETASIVRDESDRISRYYYAYRNRHYNARTEGWEDKYLLQILTTTIRILTRSKRKTQKLYYMYKGFLAGLLFHPTIEYLP